MQQLTTFFESCQNSFPKRQQALEDLLRLCFDEDKTLRLKAINTLGTVFPELSNDEKEKAWNSLLELTGTEDPEIWKIIALFLVSAFSYVPEKRKAWGCLHRLAENENMHVRIHAVEALILLFPSM